MNDALEQYLREVKRLLPCSAEEKSAVWKNSARTLPLFSNIRRVFPQKMCTLLLAPPKQSPNPLWQIRIRSSCPTECPQGEKLRLV